MCPPVAIHASRAQSRLGHPMNRATRHFRTGFSLLSVPLVSLALAGCAGQVEEVDTSEALVTRGARLEPAARHDTSPPLTLIPAASNTGSIEHEVKRLPRPASHYAALHDRVAQSVPPLLQMPATTVNFLGMGNHFTGPAGAFSFAGTPPDTNGDVGPNHYVQTVNTSFAIFNKTGTAVYGPVNVNTVFAGFGGGCQTNNDGDPVVLYDPMADRWVISQFSVNTTPYLQCVAVSSTGDPTGAWHRYSFDYGSVNFPDYPKMGVWPDAYYTTFNIFANSSSFSGPKICAYDRVKMLAGQPATQQCFDVANPNLGGVLPADMDGTTPPPAGSPNYLLALGATSTTLAFWKFHVDWTTPANTTLTGPTNLNVATFAGICSATSGDCVPQPGSAGKLQGLDDRLMFRLAYRNFGDHESLVATHAISSGSSSGIRWYELRTPATTPTIFQQGTYAPDANFRWLGSAAQDKQGNLAMGFSLSSTTVSPSIRVAGRLVGDAAGTLGQGESSVVAGGGSQTDNSGAGRNRWGDYASMSIDPTDDCTFWFTTEYMVANGGFSTWSTRVASFKYPGCGGTTTPDFTITPSPASLTVPAGGSATSSIGTTAIGTAGAVNLSVAVSPAGPTVSLSATSITAGNSSTLTFSAGSAAAGNYSVTVTGTEGSAIHSATIAVTISSAGTADFSIAAAPSSLSIVQGGSGTSAISTAVVGNAGTVNLAATVSPAGPTVSLSPASVAAGGSSTLTVSVGAAVAAGSYTVTVTGTEGSATHAATVAVTVTSSGGGGALVNGGFESALSGWTAAGTTAVVTGGHTGSAAQVGSTSPGTDSSLAQTFTLPANAATLSFWFKVVCPDTVTYDWATATLVDNVSGTTSTLLAKTCTNSGAWVQSSTSVAASAGHSVTLTLANHDDNYASDPTYTLFDDVVVGTGTPPPAGGIVNGTFETGALAPWTSTGTASVRSGAAHNGSYAARTGSTNPTSGDSTIAQTFTAPTGVTTLSLAANIVCPDTVTYDWATVTLKDNTAATSKTVLAKTCTNSGAWQTLTSTVTAGHSYTLTLLSHDDNYAGDASYVLWDDVTLN